MADHVHSQIRAAALAALTGLTTSGARAYANRLYPLQDGTAPALRIFTDAEDISIETIHAPMILSHRLELIVECCVQASTALDATADIMHKEVQIALAAGLSVAGKTLDVIPVSSQFEDADGATPVAVKRLQFIINFFTAASAPDALI
jgi:hypothetical protein